MARSLKPSKGWGGLVLTPKQLRQREPFHVGDKTFDLNRAQALFLVELMRHGNLTRAAMAAGQTHASASSQGAQWLAVPEVRAARDAMLEERKKECLVDREMLSRHLVDMLIFNPREIVDEDGEPLPLHKLPEHVARCVQEWELVEEWVPDGNKKVKVGGKLKPKMRKKRWYRPTKGWPKLAAAQQLAKLYGLEAPTKVDATVQTFDWNAVLQAVPTHVPDQVAQRIQERVEQARIKQVVDSQTNGKKEQDHEQEPH